MLSKNNMKYYLKRLLYFIIALFLCSRVFATDIKIMSFNINHGVNNNGDYTEWLEKLQWLVSKKHDIDILLLQEVPVGLISEGESSNHLTRSLGSVWRCFTTYEYELKTRTSFNGIVYLGANEYISNQVNVILYKPKKIRAEDLSKKIGFNNFQSCKYKFRKNSVQAVKFYIMGSETKNFTVINLHFAPYGKKQNKSKKPYNEMDAKTLKEMLENCYDIKSANGFIVGGDFNLSRGQLLSPNNDFEFSKWIVDGNRNNFSNPMYAIPTTLSSKNLNFANSCDHFIYDKLMEHNVKEQMSRGLDFANYEMNINGTIYQSSDKIRKEFSDHVPICMTISFD